MHLDGLSVCRIDMDFVEQFIIRAATVNPRNNNCRYNSREYCVKLWPIRHIGMDSSCVSPHLHWLSDCLCETQRLLRAEECSLGSARILHDLFRCLWCRPNDGAAVCLSLKAMPCHLNAGRKLIFTGLQYNIPRIPRYRGLWHILDGHGRGS
jgi:hypothetical protein